MSRETGNPGALRCLFLAPFVPYPPHDGGRLRVHALLHALATRRGQFLAARETVGILEAEPGAEGAGVQRGAGMKMVSPQNTRLGKLRPA